MEDREKKDSKVNTFDLDTLLRVLARKSAGFFGPMGLCSRKPNDEDKPLN